ncbi:MAG: uracil-DNA glycosylase [Burkholderiales bacterium]|nr:uracil-DNA glycosylase [Burkholderiales bacterium]
MTAPSYRADCRDCPRLAAFLDRVKADHPAYFCKPVPPFGAAEAPLVIVGLAPGMHGANRTGRPFTGDFAGHLLYGTLRKFRFATGRFSPDGDDDLTLVGCRISNAVKCLPPDNKPETAEIRRCNHFLAADLRQPGMRVLVALGLIAHGALLTALGLRKSHCTFAHGAEHPLPGGITLIDSYHCSRYNTNTGRLTPAMFEAVFARARALVDA